MLVTGHTHKLDIWQGRNGGLYINPGSVSGGLIVLKHKVADKNILAAKLAHTTMISTRVQATGAYTTSSVIVHSPSFVLMDVQGSKVVTYSYVLDGDVSEPVFCVEFEPVGAMTTLTSLILLMHSKKKEGVRVDRAAFDKAR